MYPYVMHNYIIFKRFWFFEKGRLHTIGQYLKSKYFIIHSYSLVKSVVGLINYFPAVIVYSKPYSNFLLRNKLKRPECHREYLVDDDIVHMLIMFVIYIC